MILYQQARLLITFIILMCFSCVTGENYLNKKKLIDQYYIYKYSDDQYLIECKLGCTSDLSLQGKINKVWQSNKVMLVMLTDSGSDKYVMLISERKDLKCCNTNLEFRTERITRVDSILINHGLSRNQLQLVFE